MEQEQSKRSTAKEREENGQGVRILSIDGGGIRGLIVIECLSYLSTKLFNDPTGRALFEQFDLICGTSTGGIITIGLCEGLTLTEAKSIYLDLGTKLFGGSLLSRSSRIFRFGWEKAYYSATYFESLMAQFLGNPKIREVFVTNPPPNPAMGAREIERIETGQKAFIVSTNSTKENWKPYLFRTYPMEHKQSPLPGSNETAIVDALRATSAAPTYFTPMKIDNKYFVDGGLVANNPTECAIFEAKSIWPNRKIDLILSMGTGRPKSEISSQNLLPLLGEIIDVATSSSLIHHRVKSWVNLILGPSEGTELIRFSPPSLGSIGLDESNMKVLEQMIQDTLSYITSKSGKIKKLAKKLGVNLTTSDVQHLKDYQPEAFPRIPDMPVFQRFDEEVPLSTSPSVSASGEIVLESKQNLSDSISDEQQFIEKEFLKMQMSSDKLPQLEEEAIRNSESNESK